MAGALVNFFYGSSRDIWTGNQSRKLKQNYIYKFTALVYLIVFSLSERLKGYGQWVLYS